MAVYNVVKMWELEPQRLLEHEGLLPLATLCRDEGQGEKLLQVIASKLSEIDDKGRRAEQIVSARVLAGLRYLDHLVYQILRGGDMLEESSVYQDILKKGIQQGVRKGERRLVIRQLELRLGKLSAKDRSRIDKLSTAEVERLAEALLDFSSQADMNEWLTKIA